MSVRPKPIPHEVKEVANFLAFFAAIRSYGPIDRLSRPFSFDDVVSAITDAIRQIAVQPEGGEISIRRGEEEIKVRVPKRPSDAMIQRFLELCKEDLANAKIAAALALAHAPELVVAAGGQGGGGA